MPRTSSVRPTSFAIGIDIEGASIVAIKVKAINTNTDQYQVKTADYEGHVVFNAADLSSDGTDQGTKSGFTDGDAIYITLMGDSIAKAGNSIIIIDSTKPGVNRKITAVDIASGNAGAYSL